MHHWQCSSLPKEVSHNGAQTVHRGIHQQMINLDVMALCSDAKVETLSVVDLFYGPGAERVNSSFGLQQCNQL